MIHMNTPLKNFILKYWILILMVVIKLVLQFILVNPVYELHRDEFLHLDQANHLAFGFISVPPLTSLFSKLILLLGGSLFWIRLFPALFGSLTIVFCWLIVETLGGNLLAKILAASALLFSVLLRINLLLQPNSFDILTWTIIIYLLIKFVQSGNNKWLFFLAVIIAIGIYNKYNIIFLLTGLLVSMLFFHKRELFLHSAIWKAIFITVLLLLPNIIWQVNMHFPVLHHMKVLKESQLDNNSGIGFLRSQFLIFFGSLPLTVGAMLAFIFYKPFRIYRFIGLGFILILGIFTFLKAKDYYAIGLYPMIFAFGSVYIESILAGKWKMIFIFSLIILNISITFLTARLVMPMLSPAEIVQNRASFEKLGLLRWEDGKNHSLPQDFADMTGWKEMAAKALIAYKMIPREELNSTLVFCDNYGQTGALNYYNRGQMSEAYSFNTDYIYWLPHIGKIQNILLVGNKPDERIIKMFSGFKLVGMVENEFAREKNTSVFLLTGASPDVTTMFYKMAEDRKKSFHIF
jgi:hypothetical protein